MREDDAAGGKAKLAIVSMSAWQLTLHFLSKWEQKRRKSGGFQSFRRLLSETFQRAGETRTRRINESDWGGKVEETYH